MLADIKRDIPKNVEKFKVVAIHPDGLYGNDIDIITNNQQKYQISVDKGVKLTEDLVGKYIELKHTKDENRYYFEHINYDIIKL